MFQKIFQEKKSAAGGKRPQLTACLEYVREGDILVVTRLDRLARSTLHLCQIADELKRKDVELQVLDQNINTADATGRSHGESRAADAARRGLTTQAAPHNLPSAIVLPIVGK